MKERPILFSGPMVRAILDGRKTMTRRVVKPQPTFDFPSLTMQGVGDDEGLWKLSPLDKPVRCPYGVPGDRLFPAMEIPSLGRNYCADTFGAIWSRAKDGETWKRLKGSANSKGYLSVTPAVDGRYTTRAVHRLVAEAFYGEAPENLCQVRHLSGDQTDNSPGNLDYGTQHDNWADRLLHGKASGENHHAAKLTAEQVSEIRASRASQRLLAARFKVAQSTIWGIREGITWIENPPIRPPNMPRWASRLTLRITSVRVERVQEITEEDARAEGAPRSHQGDRPHFSRHPVPNDTHRLGFVHIWDSINAARGFGWDANPWVWVVAFERVSQ